MALETGKCRHGRLPAAHAKRAPILALFFIWRLSGAPRHAYFLLNDIREVGFMQCKPSTIYALLSNMEKAGLVASRLDSSSGRPRRLYKTTVKGKALLESVKTSRLRGVWREFVRFLLK